MIRDYLVSEFFDLMDNHEQKVIWLHIEVAKNNKIQKDAIMRNIGHKKG